MMKRTIDELNDNKHKPHYYITPKRSRKNEKSIPNGEKPESAVSDQEQKPDLNQPKNETSNPFIQLNGGKEPKQHTQMRYEIYEQLKEKLMDTIEQIITTSNDDLYRNLVDFVTRDENIQSGKPQGLIEPPAKIPVGYLSLTSNSANNHRILNKFYKLMAKQKQVKLIMLNSKSATGSIKQIMTALCSQLKGQDGKPIDSVSGEELTESEPASDLEDDPVPGKVTGIPEKTGNKAAYSIEYLHRWYAKKSNLHKLVIVFEDCGTIDSQCLNTFLKLMAPHFNRYPMKLIFGVSSNNITNWINNNINNNYKPLLQNYKFVTKTNQQLFEQILQDIIITGEHKILIDETLLTIMLSRFNISNNSIDNLINEIRLSLMIHFYSNAYSRLTHDDDITDTDITVLRRLPSFKLYIEGLLHKYNKDKDEDIKHEIKQLLVDHKYTVDRFQEVKAEFQFIHANIQKLILFIHHHSSNQNLSVFDIYKLVVSTKLSNSVFFNKLYKSIEFNEVSDFLNQIDSSVKITRSDYRSKFLTMVDRFNCDKMFKEVFIISGNTFESKPPKLLENYNNLMIDLIRPRIRGLLFDKLTDSKPYLDNELIPDHIKSDVQPLVVNLFNILIEAPPVINHFEFFNAFKHSLNKPKLLQHLKHRDSGDLISQCESDDKSWEKLVFCWFLQICNEFLMMGFIREKSRGDHFEKAIWTGL